MDIITEIEAIYKCKSVYRMHGDVASELTGERCKEYFSNRGESSRGVPY